MCHWRRVRNTYLKCGHRYDLEDQMIQCEDRFCRFSLTHPSNCVPPSCTQTCWQNRQYPKQYNPQIDNWCPGCVERGIAPGIVPGRV